VTAERVQIRGLLIAAEQT